MRSSPLPSIYRLYYINYSVWKWKKILHKNSGWFNRLEHLIQPVRLVLINVWVINASKRMLIIVTINLGSIGALRIASLSPWWKTPSEESLIRYSKPRNRFSDSLLKFEIAWTEIVLNECKISVRCIEKECNNMITETCR